MSACRCTSQGPDRPCWYQMTQEDGLCDKCREGACFATSLRPPEGPTFTRNPDGSYNVSLGPDILIVHTNMEF